MIVCSGTFGRIPFVEKARAAARAGFTGISVYQRELEPGTRALLDDLGLRVAELDGPMAWLPGQPGAEPRAVIDAAAALGARSVTVLEITGELPDDAAEHFARLCDLAAPYGLTMHIEPFPWSGIPSLRGAAKIVEAAARPNGGVLLDTWHLLRGPDRGELTHTDTIVAVQACDVLPAPMSDVRTEAMHHRLPPGPQAKRIVEQLRAAGNQAPVGIEIYSDDLHRRPPAEIAAIAAEAAKLLAD